MVVSSQWYDPANTIRRIIYNEGWTWADVHTHDLNVVIPLAAQHTIALIIDLERASLLPPHGFTENVKAMGENYRQADIDVVVFTLSEASIANLLQLAHQQFGKQGCRYLCAKTPAEAAQLIADVRLRETA